MCIRDRYKYQNDLDNENYITSFTEPALYILKQSAFEEKRCV